MLLDYNTIGDQGVAALSEALKVNKTLNYLNLGIQHQNIISRIHK